MKKKKISFNNLSKKDLKGADIILNLKEIIISERDSYSSSSCSAPASFYFDTQTEHGYMEDHDMCGKIEIVESKKIKDGYLLKVKFKHESSR